MKMTCIVFGLGCMVLGTLLAMGQIHWRMSSWKKMPKAEKEKIRIVPLCRNGGMLIGAMGLVFLGRGILELSARMFVGAFAIWLLVAFIDIFFVIEKKGIYYQELGEKIAKS